MKVSTMIWLAGLLCAGAANAGSNVEACMEDVRKYCAGIEPGGGAIEACLKQNESSLSPGCMEFRREVKEKVIGFAKACAGDIKSRCAGVKPGQGRILACLKEHETALSADCKSQMTAPSNP